jgi:hypothetical protein
VIEVEAIEDIRNYGGKLIAKKGRRGRILEDWKELGPNVKVFCYASVLFDGNKVFRDVPCRSLKKYANNE